MLLTEGTEKTDQHGATKQRRTNGAARATGGRQRRPRVIVATQRKRKPVVSCVACVCLDSRPSLPASGQVARV